MRYVEALEAAAAGKSIRLASRWTEWVRKMPDGELHFVVPPVCARTCGTLFTPTEKETASRDWEVKP